MAGPLDASVQGDSNHESWVMQGGASPEWESGWPLQKGTPTPVCEETVERPKVPVPKGIKVTTDP